MDAKARRLIGALALLTTCACEELDYHGADTFYVGRLTWHLQHSAFKLTLQADSARVKVDLLALVREAFGLDERGLPITKYPSFSTTLAPTKRWLEGARVVCRARGGTPEYRGRRFDPFDCQGPPIYDELGVMEGDLLYRVEFRP